jgi:hypothetical protein
MSIKINIVDVAIVIFSGFSIWALASKRYRLGFISALCGQPFWIFLTFSAGQWGAGLISIWFTANHARGLWEHRNIKSKPLLSTGTKSLLFGVHQFIWHPITVYLAWISLYKKRPNWKDTICIIIHDWGYWGCQNMDDKKGEAHPEFAASLAHALFDKDRWQDWTYYNLCLYHSRHYARALKVEPSKLCWADKYSIVYETWWTYLPRAWASGELPEYRKIASDSGFVSECRTSREWFVWIQSRLVTLGKEKRADAVAYVNPVRPHKIEGYHE